MTSRTLLAVLALALCATPLLRADDDSLLLLRADAEELEALEDRFPIEFEEAIPTPSGPLYLVEVECDDEEQESCELGAVLAALRSDPAVFSVELDRNVDLSDGDLAEAAPVATSELPSRTPVAFGGASAWAGFVDQWATARVDLDEARARGLGGAGIVAVIDTGVDLTHPLLAPALLPGFDVVAPGGGNGSELVDVDQSTVAILEASDAAFADTPARVNQSTVAILEQSTVAILEQSTVAILEGGPFPKAFGHGTMVAGLVRLVAPEASVLPIRTFNADGLARLDQIVRAIYLAVDSGASILNLSFSLPDDSEELRRAVAHAHSAGAVVVAASGNHGTSAPVFPAAIGDLISVAATDPLDQRAVFSSYGADWVTLAAPGDRLVTAYPGGQYALVWGTSFSNALVSGSVALLAELDPALDSSGAKVALMRAEPLSDATLGAGRLDLERALEP